MRLTRLGYYIAKDQHLLRRVIGRSHLLIEVTPTL
jgi:hypothetical protein